MDFFHFPTLGFFSGIPFCWSNTLWGMCHLIVWWVLSLLRYLGCRNLLFFENWCHRSWNRSPPGSCVPSFLTYSSEATSVQPLGFLGANSEIHFFSIAIVSTSISKNKTKTGEERHGKLCFLGKQGKWMQVRSNVQNLSTNKGGRDKDHFSEKFATRVPKV